MKKRTKTITITLSILIILAIAIVLIFWGVQPVQYQDVTFEQLQAKLSKYYPIPDKLPFEEETACKIDYIYGCEGVVLVRFEISPKKAKGYSISLEDANRKINIQANGLLLANDPDKSIITTYKELSIDYVLSPEGWLRMLFTIEENCFFIHAHYDTTLPKDSMATDINAILDGLLAK